MNLYCVHHFQPLIEKLKSVSSAAAKPAPPPPPKRTSMASETVAILHPAPKMVTFEDEQEDKQAAVKKRLNKSSSGSTLGPGDILM